MTLKDILIDLMDLQKESDNKSIMSELVENNHEIIECWSEMNRISEESIVDIVESLLDHEVSFSDLSLTDSSLTLSGTVDLVL